MSAWPPEPVAFLSGCEQAELMERGELTSRALVELYLARIEAHDGNLKSFITVCGREALEAADVADAERAAGAVRGPLHGLPFAVKDQFQVRGVVVTGGSRSLAGKVAQEDATVISRLRAAGAVFLGTLNTHEFHWGPTQEFPYGTPRNPWNTDRDPGGSSSGSASSVAAGFCTFSLGGDTGGSIRAPAALCGVVGLKATWGRVPRHGVFPLAWSLDCVGPITRSVVDAAAVLEIIAGADPNDPSATMRAVPRYHRTLDGGIAGTRIGVVEDMLTERMVGSEARAAFEEAIRVLEGLGARVTRVAIPKVSDTRFVIPLLIDAEAYSYHRPGLLRDYSSYDVNTRVSAMVGAAMPAGVVAQAQRARQAVSREVLAALEGVDILASPGSPGGAPLSRKRGPVRSRKEAEEKIFGVGTSAGQLTRVFSLSGNPAVTIPCGFDVDGMPLSLQLAGRHFGEADMLRVAHAYESATAWRSLHPSLGG